METQAPEKALETADPTSSPGNRRRALVEVLTRCLQKLSAESRNAVLLRYQQGFSYVEMSEICYAKPKTLQMRVDRAMPRLRKCVREHGIEL